MIPKLFKISFVNERFSYAEGHALRFFQVTLQRMIFPSSIKKMMKMSYYRNSTFTDACRPAPLIAIFKQVYVSEIVGFFICEFKTTQILCKYFFAFSTYFFYYPSTFRLWIFQWIKFKMVFLPVTVNLYRFGAFLQDLLAQKLRTKDFHLNFLRNSIPSQWTTALQTSDTTNCKSNVNLGIIKLH